MKSKELIYLASTAILLAATANVVQAEENAPTTTDPEVAKAELQVEKDHQPQQVALPEAVPTDRQVKQESSVAKAEASPVYKAPENMAPAASLVKENVPENKASEQTKSAASEAIQKPVKAEQTSPAISVSPASKKGSTSFYNAASSAGQTARGNSQAEIKGFTFVDVSSHNGHISVEDYRQLASKGVGGVVVKLTEGTTYTNPFAESQVKNAQEAGLQVSTYAFSHYTSDSEARAEARYYAAFANRLGLPKNTVMVNDMEDPKMQNGINQHTQAWADEMRKHGYKNLMYYTSASWVDQNNLRQKGPVNTALFGLDNFWIAQYPAPKLSANDARSLKYNSRSGAWQFTSQAELLAGKHVFDQSIDYSGRFTAKSALAKQPLTGTISIQNNNPKTGTFDVIVSKVSAPHGIQEVKLPTWSTENGQDDIVWYTAAKQANGTYKLTVNAANHKGSTGEYNIHLYYIQGDGQMVGVGGTTTKVLIGKPEGKLTIANNNPKTGTFDVIVSQVSSPQGIREVLLPTWSHEHGQDDLIWHKAQKQSDGTYKFTVRASEHKNSVGDYSVHLYYVQDNGQMVGIGGTKVTVTRTESIPSVKVEIKDVRQTEGVYRVVVNRPPGAKEIKNIRVAAWSEKNQGNLHWYKTAPTGDSTEVVVNSANHYFLKGDYITHAYIDYTDGTTDGFNVGNHELDPQIKGQRDRVVQSAAALVGVQGGSEQHRLLVADYNRIRPLPVGYAVKETDDWCDIFVTVVFQRQGLSELIGRECGVERHIQIFKRLGIWNEDGNSTPKAGDIITFNWDQNSQQNDGWADHIGIVEKVENGIIYTIEGNSTNNQVQRKTYRIGHGNIRGFASPLYK